MRIPSSWRNQTAEMAGKTVTVIDAPRQNQMDGEQEIAREVAMNEMRLRLSLGREHGTRSITEQGERAAETVLADVITGAGPGIQREIIFCDCKLYGDVYGDVSRAIKLDSDQRLEDLRFTAYIWQTPNHRPPDERPWQIGMINPGQGGLELYVSPEVFEHFWAAADAPEAARPVAALIAHSDPRGVLFVSQISLELQPHRESIPVIPESAGRWTLGAPTAPARLHNLGYAIRKIWRQVIGPDPDNPTPSFWPPEAHAFKPSVREAFIFGLCVGLAPIVIMFIIALGIILGQQPH
jgi:hypothetical protein